MKSKHRDLFGTVIKSKIDKYERALRKHDRKTFYERLKRLRFLNTIFPKGYQVTTDIESIYIYDEAKMTYINGEFISSIILAQSYIERTIQKYLGSIGLGKQSRRGIKFMLKHARQHGIINRALLSRIEKLVNRRNPFTHLQDLDHEYSIMNRIQNEKLEPLEMVMADATMAMRLMYSIDRIDFRKSV